VAVIFNGPALYKRLDPKREPPIFASDRYRQVMQPSASQASIDYAATLIRAAKRPIIIAGNGVRLSKAQNALKNFAENHDIEVVTTPGGKGTFSEANPLALGIIGAFGHETANAATGRADLIIALGTKLGASDTANQHTALIDPSRQKFIQIDIEPLNLSWTTPIDAPIFGEVGEALGRLDAALGEQRFNGKASVAALRQDHPYFDHAALKQRADFSGRDAAATLSEVLPAETIVTCDAGENRLFILREYQTKVGGDVLQPNGGGGMGYAVPAAMAAAYLYKDRPVVAVCGDGGISMSLHGLMTAIELGLKMTVVVLDNQVLGWVYSSQRDRIIASSFASFDLVAMTRAMGCFAELAQTSDELRSLLGKALKHPGVSIVVAKISKTDRYQDIMSSLHKYDVYSVPENH
jgi:acetolactate synthase I/II/III large subunit